MSFPIRKVTVIFGLLLAIATLGAPASRGDAPILDPNEGWALPNSTGIVGSQNALFSESSGFATSSALFGNGKPSNGQFDPTCTSTTDSKCSFSNFTFTAQIPVCQSSSDQNCIESIGATDQNNKDYPGVFSTYYPKKAQNEYVGNPAWNLPSGVSGSLFTIPGVTGPAGNLYYTSLVLLGHGGDQQTPKVTLDDVSASITPVQLQDITAQINNNKRWCKSPGSTCNDGYNFIDAAQNGNPVWGIAGNLGADGIHNCVATSSEENSCAQKEAFPSGFNFYLKARFTLAPTGWLHGRMFNPNISLTQSNGVTELVVSAAPVAVPTVFKAYLWKDMPADLQALYDPNSGNYIRGGGGGFGRTAGTTDPLARAFTTAPAPFSATAIPQLTAWLPSVNNTAVALPHLWTFRSLTAKELASANQCFANPSQLNGIVTTNSTVYSPGPPTFDKEAGNLNYQVAAPHFTNTGEVFSGTYDLVMRSPVARCVYGFSNAPIKASISVLSATGAPEVATTVVGEKDGWLHLSANGFEFSAPTIAVTLAQDAPVVAPAPVAVQPAPAPKVVIMQRKSSILCTKGKISKTISGIAPKCPAGFKVKK